MEHKKLEESVNRVSHAIRQVRGTYDDHVKLQEDLKAIIDYINHLIEENKNGKNEPKGN
jgi:hypothetical protein